MRNKTIKYKRINFRIKNMRGFSLIELMVSSVIGLIVILAVVSVFIATQKTIGTTNALGNIQESSRIAFELMSKDLRSAGGNACSSSNKIENILKTRNNPWWTQWNQGLMGYTGNENIPGLSFGNNFKQRVTATDAIDIYSAQNDVSNIDQDMSSKTSNIQVSQNLYSPNEIVLVCDAETAFIFQISGTSGTQSLFHGENHGSIGNCASVFSYNDPCNDASLGHKFENNGLVAKVSSIRWYIGKNDHDENALFRSEMVNTTNTMTPNQINTVEVAKNISSMDITYKEDGNVNFETANEVNSWKNISSVKVSLTFQHTMNHNLVEKKLGSDGKTLKRTMTMVVKLRNR